MIEVLLINKYEIWIWKFTTLTKYLHILILINSNSLCPSLYNRILIYVFQKLIHAPCIFAFLIYHSCNMSDPSKFAEFNVTYIRLFNFHKYSGQFSIDSNLQMFCSQICPYKLFWLYYVPKTLKRIMDHVL